jgi:hypothetical protein
MVSIRRVGRYPHQPASAHQWVSHALSASSLPPLVGGGAAFTSITPASGVSYIHGVLLKLNAVEPNTQAFSGMKMLGVFIIADSPVFDAAAPKMRPTSFLTHC